MQEVPDLSRDVYAARVPVLAAGGDLEAMDHAGSVGFVQRVAVGSRGF
jgi:hypothetical protein